MFNFSFYHGPFFCIEAIEDHQLRISSNILASQIMTWMALMLITPKNCPNEDGQKDGLTKKQANYHETSTKNKLHTKNISWQIHASIREKRIMTCHHVYNAHLSKKIQMHHASLTSFSPGGLDFKNRGTKASKTEDASLVLMPRFDPNEMGEGFDGQPEGLDDEIVCVCVCMFFFLGGVYIL